MLLRANPDVWIWLVLVSLAVWRVATLICFEAGPFDLLVHARRIGYRIGLGRVLECFHCTALWTSAVLVVLVYVPSLSSVLLVLASAGAASLLERALPPAPGDEIDE